MNKDKGAKPKKLNRGIKLVLIILLAIILLALAYVAYVFISYYRIEDNQTLTVDKAAQTENAVKTSETLELTSWNIGFAAYLQDYTFFMDGGKE